MFVLEPWEMPRYVNIEWRSEEGTWEFERGIYNAHGTVNNYYKIVGDAFRRKKRSVKKFCRTGVNFFFVEEIVCKWFVRQVGGSFSWLNSTDLSIVTGEWMSRRQTQCNPNVRSCMNYIDKNSFIIFSTSISPTASMYTIAMRYLSSSIVIF